MSDPSIEKRQAARAAAALVESGMTVGLGTGSTATLVVERLGERLAQEGLRIQGVATSRATAELATRMGVPLIDLDCVAGLDIAIDGADEVDPRFRLIKGRGGALLREKIVAAAARRRVIVVSPEKLVERLGQTHEVPVEVSAFGLKHTEHALRNHGASTSVRRAADGSLVRTDEGHRIIDCRFLGIEDPEELDQRLNGIVGVFETGLFVGLCDQLVIGHADGAEILDRPPE
jgi:ribose 5-phosphate isomerase A